MMGQDEAHRADDVGRGAPQHLALDQRLVDQTEFAIFEVAQAAVNELGGRRRGGAGEIAGLGEEDAEAPAGGVAGNAAAVDAAADDGDVVEPVMHCLPLA